MQNLYVALALFLLLNLGVDMWRVLRGPTSADRMLAALVPKPRVNLTRFRGVFAPNSKHRVLVTPARQGRARATSPTLWMTCKSKPC